MTANDNKSYSKGNLYNHSRQNAKPRMTRNKLKDTKRCKGSTAQSKTNY